MDFDSGKFGQIEYRFVRDESVTKKYFTIDKISGMIRTDDSFDRVNDNDLPFRLIVEARDNPSAVGKESNAETVDVVVST